VLNCSDLGWIPSQTILDLWRRKQHWDTFLFQYFSFPVSIIPPLLNTYISIICYRLYIILGADSVVIDKDMQDIKGSAKWRTRKKVDCNSKSINRIQKIHVGQSKISVLHVKAQKNEFQN
jgi:hypothetical protein